VVLEPHDSTVFGAFKGAREALPFEASFAERLDCGVFAAMVEQSVEQPVG
jgi:hypothetical protein